MRCDLFPHGIHAEFYDADSAICYAENYAQVSCVKMGTGPYIDQSAPSVLNTVYKALGALHKPWPFNPQVA